MRSLRTATLGVLLGGGFYLLLIDTRELPELYVVPAVAGISGATVAVSARQGIGGAVKLRWLGAGWRALARVPGDIGRLVLELVLQLRHPQASRGSLRTTGIPLPNGERGVGRAAVAEALGSLSPNTIVIGVDTERGVLLVHQLRRHGDEHELDVLRET